MALSLSVQSGNNIVLNGKVIGKNVPLADALYKSQKVNSDAAKLRARGDAKAGAALRKQAGTGLGAYQTKLEFSLARTLGGQILNFSSQKSIGVQPDFINLNTGEIGDVKLNSFLGEGSTFDEAFTSAFKGEGVGDIKLAGGKGFTLKEGDQLFQGVQKSGKIQTAGIGKGLVKNLSNLIAEGKGNNTEAIISVIKKDKTLIQNLYTKANIIQFPLVLDINGKKSATILTMRLDKNELLNPQVMNYNVRKAKTNGVEIEPKIRAAVMNKLVRQNEQAVRDAFFEEFTSKEYVDGVATLALSAIRNKDVSTGRFISKMEYEGASPPLKMATAVLRAKRPKDQRNEQQRFISKIQLTELVRKRFVSKMPKGPRRGPPLSTDVLTYRTGRFANSFQIAYLNYKTNTIKYFYDPVYRVHEATSRDPQELIGNSIREVTTAAFARAFRVVRV